MKNVYILISRNKKYITDDYKNNDGSIADLNARERKEDKEQKYIVQGDIDINKIRIYFYLTERIRVKKYNDLEIEWIQPYQAIIYRKERGIKIISSDVINRFIDGYKINADEK